MAGQRGVAQVVRRRIEHRRVIGVVNDLSGGPGARTITVGQIARRARVTPDRAIQVLQRQYVRGTR